MPFRLFAEESRIFKTHIDAARAALEKGDPGYVWFGDKDLPPTWVGLHPPANQAVAELLFPHLKEQKSEQPQPLSCAAKLNGNRSE